MLIIQKDKYTEGQIKHNLLEWYDLDPDNGKEWYNEAFSFCRALSGRFKVNPVKIAGIVASLSPQKNWPENKALAVRFLSGKRSGQYGMLINKAEDILTLEEDEGLIDNITEILHGPKISAFFLNIVTSGDYVTIDRHIIASAVGYSYGQITPKGYKYLSSVIIALAKDKQVQPKVFQAVVWSNYRDTNVRKFEDKVEYPF